MEAFKKWLKENESTIIGVANDLERLDACKVSAEIVWRAALKEVLKQINESSEQPYLTLQNLIVWIKEELGK